MLNRRVQNQVIPAYPRFREVGAAVGGALARQVVNSVGRAVGNALADVPGAAYRAGKRYMSRSPGMSKKKKSKRAAVKANSGGSRLSGSRKTRRGRRTRCKNLKDVCREIRKLKKTAAIDKGRIIYRKRTTGQSAVVELGRNYQDISGNVLSLTHTEAVLALGTIFDQDVPGTPHYPINLATGTYSKSTQIVRQSISGQFRNNGTTPVRLSLYIWKPVNRTGNLPDTYRENEITDSVIVITKPASIATVESPLLTLADSKGLFSFWKIDQKKKALLQPGEEMAIYGKTPGYMYNNSLADDISEVYLPQFHSRVISYSIEGILGHDTIESEQNLLDGQCDYDIRTEVVVDYDAGMNITRIFVDDNGNTFTKTSAQPVCSSKPLADHNTYQYF